MYGKGKPIAIARTGIIKVLEKQVSIIAGIVYYALVL